MCQVQKADMYKDRSPHEERIATRIRETREWSDELLMTLLNVKLRAQE